MLTKCSWCEVCIYWLYTSNFHFYRFMSRLYWLLIILNIHLNMYNYPLLVYRFSSIYKFRYIFFAPPTLLFFAFCHPFLLCLFYLVKINTCFLANSLVYFILDYLLCYLCMTSKVPFYACCFKSFIASVNLSFLLLLLGRKSMTNPDSILKSRNISLPTMVRVVKAMWAI